MLRAFALLSILALAGCHYMSGEYVGAGHSNWSARRHASDLQQQQQFIDQHNRFMDQSAPRRTQTIIFY